MLMESGEDRETATHTEAQEAPVASLYPDWTSSLPAYYSAAATPPFFPSTVASHTPRTYMWGGQPLMSPYGTPVSYPAMYTPGAVYAHPNIAMAPSQMQANEDSDAKASEGKIKSSGKKPMKISGDKVGDRTREASGSGHYGTTQSAESGSDGSSNDESDENSNNELSASKKGSFDQMLADGAAHAQSSPVLNVPATNLNIGMNLWSSSVGPGPNTMLPNASGVSQGVVFTPVMGREGMMPEQWIPDERELKRQKRKQSNRESARRSRMRKQAECEELQNTVATLSKENLSLKEEVQRFSKECARLALENNSLKEELMKTTHGVP
ncbi:unnamed protein product [Cuscuta campestris]|nr:unnamed protein product [Cuscuta campestris]